MTVGTNYLKTLNLVFSFFFTVQCYHFNLFAYVGFLKYSGAYVVNQSGKYGEIDLQRVRPGGSLAHGSVLLSASSRFI